MSLFLDTEEVRAARVTVKSRAGDQAGARIKLANAGYDYRNPDVPATMPFKVGTTVYFPTGGAETAEEAKKAARAFLASRRPAAFPGGR